MLMGTFDNPPPGMKPSRILHHSAPDTAIPGDRWATLSTTAEVIGSCRQARHGAKVCGGDMFTMPIDPHQSPDAPLKWQDAECGTCRHQVTIPNGRVLRRSSRHEEMPSGWFQERARRLSEDQK
jgi:hypothetical protein